MIVLEYLSWILIIAGALLTQSKGGYKVSREIMANLVGTERGTRFADTAILTIRSVVKGVPSGTLQCHRSDQHLFHGQYEQ